MKRVQQSEEQEQVLPLKRVRPTVAASDALFETQILTNPLITDVIFSDILFSDLLNCCLVSKSWNLTCRSILVDRFKTYLTLSEESTVERFEEFYNVIKDVVPGHHHPFNGIRIKFNTLAWGWPFPSECFMTLLNRIMEKLQVKHLSFDMSKLHLGTTEVQILFQALVIPNLRSVTFLKIRNLKEIEHLNLSQQLKANSLPNLKELNLHLSRERLRNSTLSLILRACPSLKTFPPVFPYQLPVLRYRNKLHLASKVRFNYMCLTPKNMQLLREYGSLIQHLDISQYRNQARNVYEGEFVSKLQPLFASQLQHNLGSLDIDLEPLVALLLQKNAPALPKITKLCVRGGQAWFPCLFKNNAVRFAHFFANLKSVTFCWSSKISVWLQRNYGSAEYDLAPMSLLECEIPASLDSVSTLIILGLGRRESGDETLMKIMNLDKAFPLVTYLEIGFNHTDLRDLLRWICESWGDHLETLILRGTKCLGLHPVFPSVDYPLMILQRQRRPLALWSMYSDKLSHLRRLELEFCHPKKRNPAQYFTARKKVGGIFEPAEGHTVQVVISGCSTSKRMNSIKSGVSIYDMILALHYCPRIFGLSAMEQIIATKSICRNICKMLHTPDLFRVSLVSRRWNAVAREVIHESRPCILSIDSIDLDFSYPTPWTWLVKGKQKFFNGLSISYNIIRYSEDNDIKAVAQLLELSDFNEKTFRALKLPGHHQQFDTTDLTDADRAKSHGLRTHLIKVCKPIFRNLKLDHVENLVTSIELFDRLFRDPVAGNLLVCNVKSIDFVDSARLVEYLDVFQRLLGELRYLERIEFPVCNKLFPLVSSAGRPQCIKNIQLYQLEEGEILYEGKIRYSGDVLKMRTPEDPRTALGALLKFAQEHQPGIESLDISSNVRLHPKNVLVLSKTFGLLCTSSWESLQILSLALPLLLTIFNVFTRPMVTLKEITLFFDGAAFESLKSLARIPFPVLLPNVEVVKLMQEIFFPAFGFETLSASPPLSPPQPCTSVKSLELLVFSSYMTMAKRISGTPEPWDCWEYVAGVFPLVTNFSFTGVDLVGEEVGMEVTTKILGELWKAWPELETLSVHASDLDTACFESWILGISREEWSVWQEEVGSTPDVLNSMHYAPSSYSIRNCKSLKEVKTWCNFKSVPCSKPCLMISPFGAVFV